MDVLGTFQPVVKWNATTRDTDSIPAVVRKAFRVAQTGKMGVTHIDLPEDVAKHRALASPLNVAVSERASPNAGLVKLAAELVQHANKPVILAGNGVLRDRASQQLVNLVDQVGILVVNTFMGQGAIPASHECSLFTVGLQSRDFVAQALEEADVVCVIGYDMVKYHPRLWNRGVHKKLINIDTEPAEVDAHFVPNVDITADIGESIDSLARSLPNKELVEVDDFAH